MVLYRERDVYVLYSKILFGDFAALVVTDMQIFSLLM